MRQKILILSAIPHGLRLDKEIRAIEEAIRRATKRDLFDIRIRTAVRPQDIRLAIAEEQPQIVHFCGHGLEDGSLLLENDEGHDKTVPPEALAFLFTLHTQYVKCVLLNACYSEKTAEAISQDINYVIGMNNPIQDRAAIEFARGFYDGLGYELLNNQDIFERAFNEGLAAAKLENIVQGTIPVLKKLQTRKMVVSSEAEDDGRTVVHVDITPLDIASLSIQYRKKSLKRNRLDFYYYVRIWVDANQAFLESITQVTYFLPNYFSSNSTTVHTLDNKYAIELQAFGKFVVGVHIHLNDGTIIKQDKNIILDDNWIFRWTTYNVDI